MLLSPVRLQVSARSGRAQHTPRNFRPSQPALDRRIPPNTVARAYDTHTVVLEFLHHRRSRRNTPLRRLCSFRHARSTTTRAVVAENFNMRVISPPSPPSRTLTHNAGPSRPHQLGRQSASPPHAPSNRADDTPHRRMQPPVPAEQTLDISVARLQPLHRRLRPKSKSTGCTAKPMPSATPPSSWTGRANKHQRAQLLLQDEPRVTSPDRQHPVGN